MTRNPSRRAFLKRASALSIAGAAGPLALNLAAISEASAAVAADYKAVVCVFLYGGNDYGNTLVPYDLANYNAYKSLRPVLGFDRSALAATALSPTTPLSGSRQYALAPSLAPLLPIFNSGKLAVLLNIGTLIEPTTKAAYTNGSATLPPKLFSHNDQQSFWQACSPEGATSGWAGRMGDLLMSGNGYSQFTCVNPSSNAVLLAGRSTVQYRLTTSGPIAINALQSSLYGSSACSAALSTLVTASSSHLMEKELARLAQRSITSEGLMSSALAGAPALTTGFPANNSLASQLNLVANAIASSATLGARRQIYFVSLGGFDTHDGLATDHPVLLDQVAQAMAAFHSATVELGIADKVTTFTASDFGRSWGNDDGSDHGWGSMHFIMGGAVRGKRFFGTPPAVANNGPDDVGQGRLLPTMAVDQLAATLGKWLGLSDAQLLDVLPNLANFTTRDLGIFA